MTNYSHGHEAEQHAATYLKKQGYKVLAINWKRPRAEIDIVARKKRGPICFVEVKYRQRNNQGSGLDYITDRKVEQMQFAAELWISEHNFTGEHVLSAVELSGDDYEVTGFVETI